MVARRDMILGAACVLLLAGCAPRNRHLEDAVDANARVLAELRREQARIRQDVAGLLAFVRADDGGQLQQQAALQERLARIERRLGQMDHKLDDNAEFMRTLSARVDMLATRLGVPTVGEYKELPDSVRAADVSVLPEEGRAIFRAAMLDRSRGNTETAREGFRDFLNRYGRTELADDALYWLADMDHAAGDDRAALSWLDRLLREHPDSDRAADALLMAVQAASAVGDTTKARDYLGELQRRWPGSEQAQLAARALADTAETPED